MPGCLWNTLHFYAHLSLEHSQELLAEAGGEGVSVEGEDLTPVAAAMAILKTSSLWKSLTSTHLPQSPHRFCANNIFQLVLN